MGTLRAFYIELQNPEGIFSAGQIINGRLVVELDAEMNMREISLTFKGLADVHWTETQTNSSGDTTYEDYSASEMYFEHSQPVFGEGGS
ncbi:arrestin domain-containing protein 2-like [Saccostrea cucullata]|uniref:arrestin domain-containing protein 2-like n=1 Tax=Saccostrea cuccullata TaxID=36930 RepID=UPI002ED56A89